MMFEMAVLHDRLTNVGCALSFTEPMIAEWNLWGFHPPGHSQTPQQIADEQAGGFAGMNAVSGYWDQRSVYNLHTFWKGCSDDFDQVLFHMFLPRFNNEPRLFDGKYAAVHVRHGDKVYFGQTFTIHDLMGRLQATWPGTTDVFVATDDATVLTRDSLGGYMDQGFTFRWYKHARTPGGEPLSYDQSKVAHHDHSREAVVSAMSDLNNLALATVLVGNWNSMFFKLGWLLNYLRRTPEERQEQWCWDVFTDLPCNDRASFVMEFCQTMRARGNPKYDFNCPGNLQEMAQCVLPPR